MGDKFDIFFRGTLYSSRNRNAIRDRGYYGEPNVLSTDSNGNDLGRSMSPVGTLYNGDGLRRGNELSGQVKLPCQNASQLDRQNHYDGYEPFQPPINGEFDDLGGRREDYTNHVWSISPQWAKDANDTNRQQVNSNGESKQNTGNQMVLSACSARIRGLFIQLGPLLRVDTLGGDARKKRQSQSCHLVLPDDEPKIWKHTGDASVCQVSASDGFGEVHSNSSMVIDTLTNFNRCHIANSTGIKLYDEDQEDYISYIKEELIGYIEEVNRYGFDHIIIIGELNYGMLFLDCFGRVFNLDGMTDAIWFLGDYFKGVERVAKGLKTDRVPWFLDPDEGIIVEIKNTPPVHYTFPVEKKRKKKKSSRKKHQ